MKTKKIHHIGIVVADLAKAKRIFGDLFGMKLDHEESSDVWNVNAAFYWCGDVLLELLEPTGPGVDMDFLEERGGGLHHICYEIDDADTAYQELSGHFGMASDGPVPGNSNSRVFFLKAEDIFQIETEFLEPAKKQAE